MVIDELAFILFQYAGGGGNAQYGSWPMIGILIGIVVGIVAAVARRSGGLWGALVGAICFAGAWAVNKPERTLLTEGSGLFFQIGQGAVSGAVWCGLWGLLGGWIGKKMRAGGGEPKPSDVQLLGLTSSQKESENPPSGTQSQVEPRRVPHPKASKRSLQLAFAYIAGFLVLCAIGVFWSHRSSQKVDAAAEHNNRGSLFASSGDIDKAIPEYKEAIRLSPEYAEAHYNLGNAFISQGDVESAKAQYKMVVTPSTPNGFEIFLRSEFPGKFVKDPRRAIVLTFSDGRLIKMNMDPTSMDELGPRLTDIFKNRTERVIWLNEIQHLTFAEFMRVVEITKNAGIDRANLLIGPTPSAVTQQTPTVIPPVISGGVSLGGSGGVLGGIVGGVLSPAAPVRTPRNPADAKRLRVAAPVEATKLIFSPRPEYPPLAKMARIQGPVRLDAIINKDGTIQDLKVISGHPLLVKAAIDAVGRWRYQPTLLNGESMEVATEIDVNFSLGEQ